ncbi:hypothetical protein M413DRAFT_21676 [Hebeloma cylindrosporum]|uniref:Histone H1 n=1 Tax=Hebeloma cylindrosporum TaxID=76867 RepID=A0A0C2YI52_HEBCY|nr:hypothetical protein M413DRAFT_21676 [Hebeloma cylindrosporum h7]
MSTTKKAAATKPTVKKAAAAKAAPSHPPWVNMIKECIAANTEDARIGVSRPQIKKFVEKKYKLEIGAAQNTQLSKAINSGSDKGVFVLPKGLSGRVKLAPKSKPADTSSKENKPASKVAAKPKAAAAKPKAKATTTTAKAKPAAKSKTAASKKTATSAKAKVATVKKPVIKKTLAGKPKAKATTTTKKSTAASKRAPPKKAITGTTAASKAKTAAKKAPAKKAAAAKKEAAKPAAKVPRKSPTKRLVDVASLYLFYLFTILERTLACHLGHVTSPRLFPNLAPPVLRLPSYQFASSLLSHFLFILFVYP